MCWSIGFWLALFLGSGVGEVRSIMYLSESLLERFSYDLEMKTREQNRSDKRAEIERFDWFIERTDKHVRLFIG